MNQTLKTQNPAGRRGLAKELALGNARASYPKVPASETTRAVPLTELQTGRELTSLEAWRELGAGRLAADVHALRDAGWPILAREIIVRCRVGRLSRIASYRMHTARGAG